MPKFKVSVIFEDKDLVIVDKPSGLVVNRAESVKEKTLQDWMESGKSEIFKKKRREGEEEFFSRSGLVHRLDKETSGVIVLAKNKASFDDLKAQFKKRKVEKEYLALVHGRLSPRQGNVRLPLKRNPKRRRQFMVRLRGREALTDYQVQAYYLKEGESFSLVKVRPKTGRTHQIRVHFKHLNHPLVSDPLYQGKSLKRDLVWCPRLFLHAKSLVFSHPKKGKRMEISSSLPSDLKKTLKKLKRLL